MQVERTGDGRSLTSLQSRTHLAWPGVREKRGAGAGWSTPSRLMNAPRACKTNQQTNAHLSAGAPHDARCNAECRVPCCCWEARRDAGAMLPTTSVPEVKALL